ncbi:AraC family transcriptional regulator [Neptuniibacter sp. CAU 1671]|uniref:AraC family transcriptional regulator n=1 Tax=Neptuniibacter sp. CAU 1671 TaxID=3032593 RepID=UPI0023DC9383|nr:AraC family transcriptional regulator [Neptuniibacter sp. CAU 1671]MDF2180608.1 AraC family transcriptional regulator [Neptuniibacter sp. CAU 1671]
MPFKSKLAHSIDRFAQEEGANETPIEGLKLYRARNNVPRQPVVYKPSICALVQGHKRVYLGDQCYTYDPNHYLLNSLTLPIEAEVNDTSPEQPYLGLSLEIDTSMVSQLMLQMDAYNPAVQPAKRDNILAAAPLTSHLLHCLDRLVGMIESPQDYEILGEHIKREIYYEVLKGPQGALLRNCVANHGGAVRIASVIHYIEANFDQTLDIDTIASVAQMSPSVLHEQFKAYTSFSPMQFVKNLRLHQARTMLCSGTKASEACYKVGYSSPSQFSREFKRLFGHSPRDIQLQMAS